MYWLKSYRDGFIEFTRNDDDSECYEIVGIFTSSEALSIHTFISKDYEKLLSHAQSLFDWLTDRPKQREIHPEHSMGGANRFYLPDSDRCISFTAVRPECTVPWYPFTDKFSEPLLLVYSPSLDAIAAGWLEAELLPEYRYFDLVIYALENYFGID